MNKFTIANAQVFTGTELIGPVDVSINDGLIESVGAAIDGYAVIDATGCTLIPGLIDAHTHAGEETLRHALSFGITTELDMLSMPDEMSALREQVATSYELADVRSSSVGLTAPEGHPRQVRAALDDPSWPTATNVDEVGKFIDDRLAEGADYIKVLIEDGHVLGFGIPVLNTDILREAVRVAHDRGLMVLAHALTYEATNIAVDAGVDGLTHVFLDRPHTDDLVQKMVATNTFLIATLCVAASISGQPGGPQLAKDPRVASKLDDKWLQNLSATWGSMSEEHYKNAQNMVHALHKAGGQVLAGTDAAHLGVAGLAHGVSLHAELQLLKNAGLSNQEVLTAATAATASRFELTDRGRIAPGLRADLLLVEGNPIEDLDCTLSIRSVWRGGQSLDLAPTA